MSTNRGKRVTLTISQLGLGEVYKDMARIPEQYRVDHKGRPIPEGRICKVSVGKASVLLSLRGKQNQEQPSIHIDDKTRIALGLSESREADFRIRQVGWLGQFLWAWRASDPAYRIAARVGLVSLLFGVAGLALGLIGILIAIQD